MSDHPRLTRSAGDFDLARARREKLAAQNGPTIQAMRAWIGGARVLPLDEQIKSFGYRYRSYRALWAAHGLGFRGADMYDTIALTEERQHFIEEFGFSLPTAEALALLVAGGPLLEVGAGSGYWSRLVAQQGGDVVASDPRLERMYGFEHARHLEDAPVRVPWLDIEAKTAVRRFPKRNVFSSWPSLNKTWLRQAMRAMRPGRTLFVVREESAAEDSTWAELHLNFRCAASLELLSWHHCHDRFEAWKKRGGPHRRPDPEKPAWDYDDDNYPPDEAGG